MEKALETRLIVCCLVGHLLFFCLLSNAFPDFGSVIRSVRKEKKPKKWRRSLELGGLVPRHNNMRSLVITRRGYDSNMNSVKKDEKTLAHCMAE